MAGVSNSSLIKCRISDGLKPNSWSAGVLNACNNLMLVSLQAPPTSVIGRARLSIDTMRQPQSMTDSVLSMSIADEYDVITGGYDVRELEVTADA